MSILFMGGEPIDFDTLNNTVTVSGAIETFRNKFARCSMQCQGSNADFYNNASGKFAKASSDFWFTARMHCTIGALSASYLTFLTFYDKGVKRLGFQMNDQRQLRVVRYQSGVPDAVIATSSATAIQTGGVHKIDVHAVYNTFGRVTVYMDQAMVLDFGGDITAGGSTSLDGFGISSFNNSTNNATYWSECIAIERDSRTLMMKTHTPAAAKPNSQWDGDVANIAEIVPDDSTIITTNQPDQYARFSVDALPTDKLAVAGFKVNARVSRGPGGPQGLQVGVTTGITTSTSSTFPVDTGWSNVSQIFENNPTNNAPWTENDINTIEIDFLSK